MVDTASKIPVKADANAPAPATSPWFSYDALRREVDRLFDDFGNGWFKTLPARAFNADAARGLDLKVPAVDIVEKERGYEVTAEVPGLDANGLEVTLRNGNLVIKGEKQEEIDENGKDYHLHERRFGSFERAFAIPDGVDEDKIEARFDKGVLTVSMPKTAAAQQPEKKIEVKAA